MDKYVVWVNSSTPPSRGKAPPRQVQRPDGSPWIAVVGTLHELRYMLKVSDDGKSISEVLKPKVANKFAYDGNGIVPAMTIEDFQPDVAPAKRAAAAAAPAAASGAAAAVSAAVAPAGPLAAAAAAAGPAPGRRARGADATNIADVKFMPDQALAVVLAERDKAFLEDVLLTRFNDAGYPDGKEPIVDVDAKYIDESKLDAQKQYVMCFVTKKDMDATANAKDPAAVQLPLVFLHMIIDRRRASDGKRRVLYLRGFPHTKQRSTGCLTVVYDEKGQPVVKQRNSMNGLSVSNWRADGRPIGNANIGYAWSKSGRISSKNSPYFRAFRGAEPPKAAAAAGGGGERKTPAENKRPELPPVLPAVEFDIDTQVVMLFANSQTAVMRQLFEIGDDDKQFVDYEIKDETGGVNKLIDTLPDGTPVLFLVFTAEQKRWVEHRPNAAPIPLFVAQIRRSNRKLFGVRRFRSNLKSLLTLAPRDRLGVRTITDRGEKKVEPIEKIPSTLFHPWNAWRGNAASRPEWQKLASEPLPLDEEESDKKEEEEEESDDDDDEAGYDEPDEFGADEAWLLLLREKHSTVSALEQVCAERVEQKETLEFPADRPQPALEVTNLGALPRGRQVLLLVTTRAQQEKSQQTMQRPLLLLQVQRLAEKLVLRRVFKNDQVRFQWQVGALEVAARDPDGNFFGLSASTKVTSSQLAVATKALELDKNPLWTALRAPRAGAAKILPLIETKDRFRGADIKPKKKKKKEEGGFDEKMPAAAAPKAAADEALFNVAESVWIEVIDSQPPYLKKLFASKFIGSKFVELTDIADFAFPHKAELMLNKNLPVLLVVFTKDQLLSMQAPVPQYPQPLFMAELKHGHGGALLGVRKFTVNPEQKLTGMWEKDGNRIKLAAQRKDGSVFSFRDVTESLLAPWSRLASPALSNDWKHLPDAGSPVEDKKGDPPEAEEEELVHSAEEEEEPEAEEEEEAEEAKDSQPDEEEEEELVHEGKSRISRKLTWKAFLKQLTLVFEEDSDQIDQYDLEYTKDLFPRYPPPG